MNKTAKTILWIVAIVVVVWLGYKASQTSNKGIADQPTSAGQAEQGTIKIGLMMPLTGDIAALGQSIKNAVEIARDRVNDAGGVNGRKVELVEEDSKCEAKTAASVASKLINADKVVAIVGAGCSSETLAAAPIAEQAGIVMVSPVSTNPKITAAGDYIFRFVPSDAYQGKFAAEYAVEKLGKKKIATISCLSDWCVGLNNVFKARAAELGATIVATEENRQEDRDLRAQITKVKAADPELVYVPQYTEALIVFFKQAKELGITATILTGDVGSDPKVWSESGASAEGAYYTVPKNADMPQWFTDEMKKKIGGAEITSYAPRGYDSFMALTDIIKKVGTDGTKIKDAFYGIKDYQGIADVYTMDQNGDMSTAAYTVYRYKSGKTEVVQ